MNHQLNIFLIALKNFLENNLMKILLTGATGFLGSNVLNGLISNAENHLFCLIRNQSNLERIKNHLDKINLFNIDNEPIENLFANNKFDIVVHCATSYGIKDGNPINTIESNLILPLKILHYASINNCGVFINTDTILDKRINHYSLSKKHFLDWFKSYSSSIKCINIELEHFYGPHDNKDKFCSFIVDSFFENKKFIELTPGEQKRDFIFIDDVVEAFRTIIDKLDKIHNSYTNFQLGTGKTVSIKEFVSMAKKISQNSNTELRFGALKYRKNEVMNSKVDISALKSLGWSPKITLSEGLTKPINTRNTG